MRPKLPLIAGSYVLRKRLSRVYATRADTWMSVMS